MFPVDYFLFIHHHHHHYQVSHPDKYRSRVELTKANKLRAMVNA